MLNTYTLFRGHLYIRARVLARIYKLYTLGFNNLSIVRVIVLFLYRVHIPEFCGLQVSDTFLSFVIIVSANNLAIVIPLHAS